VQVIWVGATVKKKTHHLGIWLGCSKRCGILETLRASVDISSEQESKKSEIEIWSDREAIGGSAGTR